MADLNENNMESTSTNRVVWLDPNMGDNKIVNTEDLSIKVEFTATRKDRSIIYSGKETVSTAGGAGAVNFISGTPNGAGEQPSLTTRYTEAIALDVMNTTAQNADDFESLGIESIDIEFNTAYAPLIKIKFIDVRGNAILSQGNMSKYRMFFELPYPIFSLKVKGFYGKTVNYCLHMQRWNASFNSETGNFEIQAEFIGYTYALLTDMLMGLIRAAVRTKRGQDKLALKQQAYGDNSNLIISIDDMLSKLSDLNFSFKKIGEDDDSVQQINAYDSIEGDLKSVKSEIDILSNAIYDGQTPPNNYFKSENGYVIGIPIDGATTKRADDAIKTYNDTVTTLVNNINANISENAFKLNLEQLTFVPKFTEVTYGELSGEDDITIAPILIKKSGNKYDGNNQEDIKKVLIILKDIRTSIKTPLPADTKINIYSLLRPYYHIDERIASLESNKNSTTQQIGEKLANEAESVVGFEPTIRNIFRVLSVNCEIFLEVLRDVSLEAQSDEDGKRAEEFKKISGKINVNNKEIEGGNIYPWPEYRQKKNNEGYVETWLGSAPGIIPNNIEEVVFVEEMLKALMDVAKFDKELSERTADNQGLDIDSAPEQIKNPWFPISIVDTPVSGVEENPYMSVCDGNVDETIRLVLLRAVLLLGISAYNKKIDPNIVNTYGLLEAENLYEAAKKTENGLNVIKQLQNIYGKTDPKSQTDSILFFNGLQGRDTIKNPGVGEGVKKPILSEITRTIDGKNVKDYEYVYINDSKVWNGKKFVEGKTKRAYIPINNNYDGLEFYNGKNLKKESSLKNLAQNTIFVSNPKNLKGYSTGKYTSNDDGSYLFKIIDKNTYQSRMMAPAYATDVIEKYKTTFGGKTINVSSYGDSYIENGVNKKKILIGTNPLGGNYAALEFKNLDYNGYSTNSYTNDVGEGYTSSRDKITTSLTSFYTQNVTEIKWKVGSYLTLKPLTLFNQPYNKDTDYFKNMIPKDPKPNEEYTIGRWQSKIYIDDIFVIDGFRPHKEFGKQKLLIEQKLNGSAKPYVPFIEFGYDEYYTLSLFGSVFYNNQINTNSKAILFLHTFPWQGVSVPGDEISEYAMLDTRYDRGLEETSRHSTRIWSIQSMFKLNGAFIEAPKAWALLIGGMLWRLRYAATNNGKDPIEWEVDTAGSIYQQIFGNTSIMQPAIGNFSTKIPTVREFLYFSEEFNEPWGMYFVNRGDNPNTSGENNVYTPIDNTILGLPKDVKNEFISYFENWVNDETNGFKYFQKELEIWYGKDSDKPSSQKSLDYYKAKWTKLEKLRKDGASSSEPEGKSKIKASKVKDIFNDNPNLFNNYAMISTVYDTDVNPYFTQGGNFQIQLELRPETEVMDNIVGLLTEGVYLQNVNPNIWTPTAKVLLSSVDSTKDYYNRIIADGEYLNLFLEQFFTRINATQPTNEVTEDDQIQQEIFGTTDDKTIKLLIYRTLSSINDKWINGTPDSAIFGQCSGSNKNQKDIELGKKFRSGATTAELIDTFRFVDRAFWDIGDKFYLNILSVSELIKSNYNQSFFDVVNKILTDNNFNFIPLPTFVNFNSVDELKTVFTPYSYNDEVGFSGTGPSFVCVYVGQTSTNLDLGVDSVYPDDGLSLTMDGNTKALNLIDELEDFSKPLEPGEFNVPVFAVNYGQQNQSYFKSVKLDQREFTETMESLQIIEDISQTGDKSKPTYAGNNLFNVYQTRSYSAEIEMMGSAMIQPMMYFQLNNIPMFRGAYLIYKVNHSIKPHNMITTIKGNRVKKSKTPLVDKYTMYMNLVGNNGGSGTANIRAAGGDPNSKPESKFIDTNLQFYWLDSKGNIPTGKDTLGLTNKNKQFTGLKNVANNNSYAVREVVEVLQKTGFDFYNKNKDNAKAPDTIYYNDLSRLWGGPLSPHRSHQKGLTIDIYQSRDDKGGYSAIRCTDGEGHYSRKYTSQWLTKLLSTPYRKYTIPNDYTGTINYIDINGDEKTAKGGDTIKDQKTIRQIFFNDEGLQTEINGKYGNVMSSLENHCSHLHIEFYSPVRVTVEAELGENTRPATEANPTDVGSKSTSLTDEALSENQVKVKNYFKAKGLSKVAVAGIMGNIQKESSFNPNALNPKDSNGLPSYGIIQWNQNTATKSQVGSTLDSQLDYLVVFGGRYKKYLNKLIDLTKENKSADASQAAYWFAYYVEVCGGCTTTYDKFLEKNNNKTAERSSYAIDFFKRFNTAGDSLKW